MHKYMCALTRSALRGPGLGFENVVSLLYVKVKKAEQSLCPAAEMSSCLFHVSLLIGLTYMCLSVGLGSLVSVPQSTRQNALSHSLLMVVHLSHNDTDVGNRLPGIRCVTCCRVKGNPHHLFVFVL